MGSFDIATVVVAVISVIGLVLYGVSLVLWPEWTGISKRETKTSSNGEVAQPSSDVPQNNQKS